MLPLPLPRLLLLRLRQLPWAWQLLSPSEPMRREERPSRSLAVAIAQGNTRAASSSSKEGLQAATILAARFQIWTPIALEVRRSMSAAQTAP